MAKSSRASRIKKNHQALKKKVFGPAELARNERLSAKLLELASQPKALRSEMEIEVVGNEAEEDHSTEQPRDAEQQGDDVDMDALNAAKSERGPPSQTAQRRRKEADKVRIEKKRHRKERNRLVFKTGGKKGSRGDSVGKVKAKSRKR